MRDKKITFILNCMMAIFLLVPIVLATNNTNQITKIKSNTSYDVTLLISDWDGKSYLGGLNVSIYDLNGTLVLSGISNSSGCLSVTLEKKPYIVIVRNNNKKVGYQEIHVNASKPILIRTWAYTLRATCIDQEEDYIFGAAVFLYTQPSNVNSNTNESWLLTKVSKTDENGTVTFDRVWNGTYKITVESGRIIGEKIVDITKSEHIVIKCDITFLELKVVSSTPMEYPLSNASVSLQDSDGHIFLRGYTDNEGNIRFDNVYVDNYTIFIDWLGTEVFSGVIDTRVTKTLKIKAKVFEVTLRVSDSSGKGLPHSRVLAKKITGRWTRKILKDTETDENGLVSFLLPSGKYEISCVQGIYSGGITMDLTDNYSGTIQCNIHPNVWILIFFASIPLSILSLILERKKLRRPLEYKRYRGMLSKLEEMYSNGLVEYKIYRKLKEEYETKLMELGGRRRR